MVRLVTLASKGSDVLAVTTGATVATCTAVPLLPPSVLTDALRIVAEARTLRPLSPVTVNCVAVAAVTVPVTLLLKLTRLFPGVALSKPAPLMVMVVAVTPTVAVVDAATTGVSVAICTAGPLLIPLLVTEALRAPATRPPGLASVNLVTVAAVTVALTLPQAPLKVTTLFASWWRSQIR